MGDDSVERAQNRSYTEFECEHRCGFKGPFAAVQAHELSCAASAAGSASTAEGAPMEIAMPAEVVFGGQQKAVTAEATVSLEGEFIDTRTAPERPASAVAARLAELRGQLSEEDELQQELREEIGNAQDVISQSEHFIEWARQEVEVDLQDVGGTPPPPPPPPHTPPLPPDPCGIPFAMPHLPKPWCANFLCGHEPRQDGSGVDSNRQLSGAFRGPGERGSVPGAAGPGPGPNHRPPGTHG